MYCFTNLQSVGINVRLDGTDANAETKKNVFADVNIHSLSIVLFFLVNELFR